MTAQPETTRPETTQRETTQPATDAPATRRERLILHLVAGVLTLAVFAPLLRPGYVLRFDLIFVPKQPLRWDLIAPTDGLPRAVPQDLIVSLVNLAVPGWLVERVVLMGALYLAVYGAGRLVPASGVLPRVVAAVGYGWAPFLAERLLLGQWGLLLAYAALPWLVAAALGVRAGRAGSLPRLLVAAAVSAITPTGGVIAVGVTMGLTVRRGSWRNLLPTVATIGLNAPWIAAAVLANADGRSDPDGVAAFALRGENWSGPVGALAGTGGIWNAQTAPVSRASDAVPGVTAVLVGLAIWGWRDLWRRWGAGAIRLAGVAGAGVVVALAGAVPVASAGTAWLVGAVPGAGILRDGQKFLMPYALVLALGVALGAQRLANRLAEPAGRLVLVAAAALPVAVMPDLAWGAAGTLHPVPYPADWNAVAAVVAADPGEVLALPFAEYRSYRWNGGQIVIDPAPRYLPAPVVTDDILYVSAMTVDGENGRAAGVRELLDRGGSAAEAGTRWVLVDRSAAQSTPPTALAGLVPAYVGPDLELYANPGTVAAARPPTYRRMVVGVAHGVAAAVVLGAVWLLRKKPTPW